MNKIPKVNTYFWIMKLAVDQRSLCTGSGSCLIASRISGNRLRFFAERVMMFALARTPMRFSSLGIGRMMWEPDTDSLDHYQIFSPGSLSHLFIES